jgi:glutamate synthase domain-containing protein 1
MACEQEIERAIHAEGQLLRMARRAHRQRGLSLRTKEVEPIIRSVFVARGFARHGPDAFERKRYIIRKRAGHAIHVAQTSAMAAILRAVVLDAHDHLQGHAACVTGREYYPDLHDSSMVTAGDGAPAILHQHISDVGLGPPFRYICHNGEINTLAGNFTGYARAKARSRREVLGDDLHKLWPLIYDGQSDSASFDNARSCSSWAGIHGARDEDDDSRSGRSGTNPLDGRGSSARLRESHASR